MGGLRQRGYWLWCVSRISTGRVNIYFISSQMKGLTEPRVDAMQAEAVAASPQPSSAVNDTNPYILDCLHERSQHQVLAQEAAQAVREVSDIYVVLSGRLLAMQYALRSYSLTSLTLEPISLDSLRASRSLSTSFRNCGWSVIHVS